MTKFKVKRFNRWEIYKRINKNYNDMLEDKSINQKIEILQREYNRIQNDIDKIKIITIDIKSILNNYERRELEVEIDIIRKYIEDIFDKNEIDIFQYPELFDKEFAKKIYEKKEFYINKMPIGMVLQESSNKPRQRTSIQKFVKNYISEYTPYNGILLWHGVGVGKTCAGISIAENFRSYVQASNQKLLVLTPSDTLVQTWKDEIFNIEKEEMKRKTGQIVNVQCTGDRYLSELKKINSDSFEISRREVSRLINKYYEIMGYQKLANQINKELLAFVKDKKYQQRAVIDYFKQKFSNRVIIMDEVHFTREDGSANDKVARPFLEMIARYAENVKLVLLSATPMYNISSEITWILNLLLLNDKRAPLETDELFESNGIKLKELTPSGEKVIDIIRKKSRGYISYLRSENPLTFPLKLYPWDESLIYEPNPEYQLVAGEEVILDEKDKIKGLTFVKDSMSDWQYQNVLKYMNIITEKDEEIDIDDISDSKTGFTSKPTQASNIVFPLPERDSDEEFIGEIGRQGFNSCLIENSKKKLEYASHVRKRNEFDLKDEDGKDIEEPFLHRNNIAKYSSKFKTIIDSIINSTGIIFVYSQYVDSGVRSLACALEANGFTRYVGEGKDDNLLSEPSSDKFCVINKKFKSELSKEELKFFRPAKYILLDGSVNKNQLNKLVKECRGTLENPNTNGEFIKVVLGTKVIETGISFQRIREIHILDPWHHLNTMEQAAGRGIRNFSHIQLPVSERNVTLFLHIGALPINNESGLETNDERIYRRAFLKKKNMAIVERQLKISAVDCGLNKMGNIFVPELYSDVKDNPLVDREVINSKDKRRVMNLYDKDGSMICDFEECYYQCEPAIKDIKIDNSTFNEFYAEDEIFLVKELIKNLFLEEYTYTDKEIFNFLREMKIELEDHYVYLALNDLVSNKEEVFDGYYRPGYIINRVNYIEERPELSTNFYIYQPKYLNDPDLPMQHRYIPKNNFKEKVKLRKLKLGKVQGLSTRPETGGPLSIRIRERELPQCPIENIIEILYSNVNKTYKSIESLLSSRNDSPNLPSESQLEQYLLQSQLDSLLVNDKIKLFEFLIPLLNLYPDLSVLPEEIKKYELILRTVLGYYDKQNRNDEGYLFLRSKRDLYDKAEQTIGDISKNEIVGFRIIYKPLGKSGERKYEGETKIEYYLYRKKEGESVYEFKKLSQIANNDLNEKLKIPKEVYTFSDNKNPVYGYMNYDGSKYVLNEIKCLETLFKNIQLKFFIVNKDESGPGKFIGKTNLDGTLMKKSERRGAVCGSAIGAMNGSDFKWLIDNYLLEYTGSKMLMGKMDYQKIFIELLLRHKEQINDKKGYKYFYRIEETLL